MLPKFTLENYLALITGVLNLIMTVMELPGYLVDVIPTPRQNKVEITWIQFKWVMSFKIDQASLSRIRHVAIASLWSNLLLAERL